MDSLKYKNGSRVLNTSVSLILFLIFTLCMLMIIGSGAGIYSRIKSGYEASYGSSAAIKYISNKIRASDSCSIADDGKTVIITDGGLTCVIYSKDGGIYEKTVVSGSEISTEGGNHVSSAENINVSEKDGLYEISVTHNGETMSVLLRKGVNHVENR